MDAHQVHHEQNEHLQADMFKEDREIAAHQQKVIKWFLRLKRMPIQHRTIDNLTQRCEGSRLEENQGSGPQRV